MNEKNRTHAQMVISLADGLAKSLDVAEATGTLNELKPMLNRTNESLSTCEYRDEEDFREAQERAEDTLNVIGVEGYSRWVKASTRDLIRDLRTIHDGFGK